MWDLQPFKNIIHDRISDMQGSTVGSPKTPQCSHVWETNSCCVGIAISQTAVLHNKSSCCQIQRFFDFDVFRCGKLSCTATWITFNQSWAWKSVTNHPSFVYSFVRSFFACNTCTKLGSIVNSRSKFRANKNNNPAGQRRLQYSGNVPKS